MTAENYHLKWDSHATYLNSSVASLYKNDKYADVVLYSSNTTSTTTSPFSAVGISAHKFILSSCSQYFAVIFENSPLPTNGLIHIVLPPDLSHRAIQILVQYMYAGEATVSNDILNEVLKGGEILKIRGLCRTNNAPTTNLNQTTTQNATQASYNLTRMPPMATTATTVRYLVEQSPPPVLGRGLIASVLPKDSPVIIKTAKPLSSLAAVSSASAPVMAKMPATAIAVSKHVGLDPSSDAKCRFAQEPVIPPPPITNVREDTSVICQDVSCNGCPRVNKSHQHQIMVTRERTDLEETPQVICIKPCSETRSHVEYITQTSSDCAEADPSLIYEQEMESATTSLPPDQHPEGVLSYSGGNNYNYAHTMPRPNQTVLVEGEVQHLVSTSPSVLEPTGTTFVAIKEEPTEWLPPSSTTNSTQKTPSTIKLEPSHIASTSSSSMSSHDAIKDISQPLITGSRIVSNDFDHYFACDVCKKTCEDKASLLRHLETHSTAPSTSAYNASAVDATALPSTSNQSKSYVPKKRRRTSQQENSADHVCLQCDLCSTRFETPAEWVRHMSTQHTDVELAIFNSRKDSEKSKTNAPSTSNASNKKSGSTLQSQSQQQHHLPQQRVQAPPGSTNTNITSSNTITSMICTPSSHETVNDANVTDNLRYTLSPA